MRLFGFGKPGNGNGASSARRRIVILLAVLVALDVLLLVLQFRPPGRSLVERQAELKQSRARYDETFATVRQMRDLRGKLESAIENNQSFSKDRFLVRKTAFSAMLTDLEKLASENKLKTASIGYKLKEDTKQAGYIDVAVTMGVEGAYPDLMNFINHVEKSNLFWIIDTLNVSTTQSHGLRLNLQMVTYAVGS